MRLAKHNPGRGQWKDLAKLVNANKKGAKSSKSKKGKKVRCHGPEKGKKVRCHGLKKGKKVRCPRLAALACCVAWPVAQRMLMFSPLFARTPVETLQSTQRPRQSSRRRLDCHRQRR